MGAWKPRRAGFLLRDPLCSHMPPQLDAAPRWHWPSGHQHSLIPLGRKGSPADPPASAFFAWILSNFSSCAACTRNTIVLGFSVVGRRPQKNKCPVRGRGSFLWLRGCPCACGWHSARHTAHGTQHTAERRARDCEQTLTPAVNRLHQVPLKSVKVPFNLC